MWLTKVESLTQREVASRLGINQKAVEKQVSRGIRLLAEALFGGTLDVEIRNEVRSFQDVSVGAKQRTD
jgi:predicted DNA-binding protein (UPF0251 family)